MCPSVCGQEVFEAHAHLPGHGAPLSGPDLTIPRDGSECLIKCMYKAQLPETHAHRPGHGDTLSGPHPIPASILHEYDSSPVHWSCISEGMAPIPCGGSYA